MSVVCEVGGGGEGGGVEGGGGFMYVEVDYIQVNQYVILTEYMFLLIPLLKLMLPKPSSPAL